MTKIIFDNLDIFPEWFRTVILSVWGALFVAIPIYMIIAYAQKEPVKVFYKTLKLLISHLFKSLGAQIDDPIKYPRIQKVLEWCMICMSYILAIILFISFVTLVFAWGLSSKKLLILQQFGVLSYSMVCLYFSAVLKTQANKMLLKLRAVN